VTARLQFLAASQSRETGSDDGNMHGVRSFDAKVVQTQKNRSRLQAMNGLERFQDADLVALAYSSPSAGQSRM
jgi:hypothetical protein